ncbi:MAG: hypothetical protein HOG89_02820 [Candidatus Peribacter sp.]|jgi:hypothetical protein|nr:hypothetical protein [Candidatus Peribacter sp.]MBT4392708.1 hypothetical protein [Candidatus Peribacter sp.]MBT4600675.1 hypothetical protein [Candidatus Peribacter sp.]MBT5148656.1 hypothetical protein [Candidatus Peribacter sp.]MBT5637749.1 hypothetical protein [Candidatus Peribacter sp.]
MISSLLLSLGVIEKAYASPYFGYYCSALGTYCGDGQGFIIHIAVRTANVIVIPVVGAIAVIAILWASLKMISSAGDDQGKEEAKKIILGAVTGIILAVTGVAIVNWVCRLVELATNGSGLCA